MHSDVGESAEEERDAAREAVAQRLRELPNEAPPPFDWSDLQRRMQMKSAKGWVRGRAVTGSAAVSPRRALAVIAGAVVIAAAVLIMNRFEQGGDELARMGPEAGQAQRAQSDTRLSGPGGSEAEALLARADSAERWLADRPDDGARVRVSTHLAIANLEDRVAAMDDLLNLERLQHVQSSRLRVLQLQRAQLVDSLAQARYAEMLVEETP